MIVSVIVGHPSRESFNHAIANAAVETLKRNKHTVLFHDLYAEQFNPLLPPDELPKNAVLPQLINQHCNELVSAKGIVVVHPNWWGQPPAVMKGWIDRVFRAGVAYDFQEGDGGEGVPRGLLQLKTALIINTSNTPTERERIAFGDPLDTIWKNCIFGLCGVTDVRRTTFSVVVTSTEEKRRQWLQETRKMVEACFGQG